MNRKNWQSIYHANVNIDLVKNNVLQINGEITINLDVSVKKFMYVKKIMFWILQYVILKM